MKRLSRTLLFRTALSNFLIVFVLLCALLLLHAHIHHHSLFHGGLSRSVLLEDFLLFSVVSLFAALITALLLTVNIRFHMGNIISLLATSRKVRDGDLSARCHVTAADETGELAAQFNEMLDCIDSINQSLEEKVRERTLQLEASNRNYRQPESDMNDLLTFNRHLSSLSGQLLTAPINAMPECIASELELMLQLQKVDFIALFLSSEHDGPFLLIDQKIRTGEPIPLFPESTTMFMSLETVLREGKTIVYESLDNTLFSDFPDAGDLFRRIGINAMAAIPLNISKRVAGAIIVGNRKETYWPESLPRRIKLCGEVMAGAWIRYRSEADLARSRDRLRALAMELGSTEERQSDLLATWIHDKVGQELALLKIRLGMVQQRSEEPDLQNEISGLRESVDTLIRECRERVLDLSPPILHELGPGPAIEWCAHRVIPSNGPDLTLSITTDAATLPRAISTVLFRCARELMVNAVKHARARHVTVALHEIEGTIEFTMEDDGIGIPSAILAHPAIAAGFGLMSIIERVDDLGGSFTLTRRPGGGTIARLCFARTGTDVSSGTTAKMKETVHACLH